MRLGSFQLDLFVKIYQPCEYIEIEDIFEAYYCCRKHKRQSVNTLLFELDFEKKLVELWREINSGCYKPRQSMAFIVKMPVQREIFAADFRDRIVHHLVVNKINKLLEGYFIDDSYSCRHGKGVLAGVKKAFEYMQLSSENYISDSYAMKLDLKSFFPSINKHILFEKLAEFLNREYLGKDKRLLVDLFEAIIFSEPQKNYFIKGSLNDWVGLPLSKSLFNCGEYKGLPIGNLTSQVLANFYLTTLDKFIKNDLGVRYYIRYVDDLLIFHSDKQYLLKVRERIKVFVRKELEAEIHPNKFYLQHYSKGVLFLGAYIKPKRIYIGKRTKGNLYRKIHNSFEDLEHFVASINSYFGYMKHYNTYNLRKKIVKEIGKKDKLIIKGDNSYLKINNKFNKNRQMERKLRKNRSLIKL